MHHEFITSDAKPACKCNTGEEEAEKRIKRNEMQFAQKQRRMGSSPMHMGLRQGSKAKVVQKFQSCVAPRSSENNGGMETKRESLEENNDRHEHSTTTQMPNRNSS